eukprot:TRINITY_DN105384_c0_g1_i1.p1 TRINITY_DN105384_c0_g1~~TRINITY_DN105384_c0_g1_i1.p1  ORF type:complete len:685 (-),score=101.43 TRINITY_DN105384_c0_g1_i1:127-2157(-)
MAATDYGYPLQLGLAYLLLSGYVLRTLFVTAKLPGAVGVLLSGFIFSHFMQSDILEGRDDLQECAFFLVLLTAGCEISVRDLKPYMIVLGLLPCTCELLGVACYARYVFGYTWIESAVTGTVLFSLADGLVIPKMGEFGKAFPGHHLPRLMFTCAPLEASWALTLFGVIQGFADQSRQPATSPAIIVLANVLRLVATVTLGIAMGVGVGWVVNHRQRLEDDFNIKFTHQTVEAYLLVLGVALAAFSLGMRAEDVFLVPMGIAPGSMFQPELLVIVLGSAFGTVTDTEMLHGIESTMGGVWVFGQLILFSMLGSKSDVSVFSISQVTVPMLGVGLLCRFVGVLIATRCTVQWRKKGSSDQDWERMRNDAWYESLFIFLSACPRATIQGALGPVPATDRFFHSDPARAHVQSFIALASRFYIVCMSVLGCILLHIFGPLILEKTDPGQGRAGSRQSIRYGKVSVSGAPIQQELLQEQEGDTIPEDDEDHHILGVEHNSLMWKASDRDFHRTMRRTLKKGLSVTFEEPEDISRQVARASVAKLRDVPEEQEMTDYNKDVEASRSSVRDGASKLRKSLLMLGEAAPQDSSEEAQLEASLMGLMSDQFEIDQHDLHKFVKENARRTSVVPEPSKKPGGLQPSSPSFPIRMASAEEGLGHILKLIMPSRGNTRDSVSRLQVF